MSEQSGQLMAPPGLTCVNSERFQGKAMTVQPELLADETAVALLYNGEPHVVMMATPLDLDDLAIGFSLSEGIVCSPDQLQVVDVVRSELGVSVHMAIDQRSADALAARQRGISARSGCGLCGTSTLAAAMRPIRHLEQVSLPPLAPDQLSAAFAELKRQQRLNAACGALHGAGLMHAGGLLVREDVGRHNALDKVLGAAAAAGIQGQAVLMTSRASYELVHKAAQCGIPVLAAISGPTALAVRLAREAGLRLIGYAREQRFTVYA